MIRYADPLKQIEQIARMTARGGALTPAGHLVMTPNAIRHRKRKAKAAPNVVAPNATPNKRQSGLKDKAARNAYQRAYMAKRRAKFIQAPSS